MDSRPLVALLSMLGPLGCSGSSSHEAHNLDAQVDAQVDASETRDDAGADLEAGADAQSDAGSGLDFAPSNVPPEQLPAEIPEVDLEIAERCDIHTEEGRLRCPGSIVDHSAAFRFAIVERDNGARLGVLRVRGLRVDVGGELSVRGGLPLVVVAEHAIQVLGRVSASSDERTAVGGGFGPSFEQPVGNGPGAGSLGVTGHFRASSGGGYCGRGGRGAAEGGEGVAGGAPYGSEALVPLLGGSSGGGPEGGAGGGALQLSAGERVVVGETGVVDAGGGGGRRASGGGSGGALLLEAPAVQVLGTLAANGGGGAAAVGGSGGQNALPSATAAAGELEVLGGEGSAGDQIDGADGQFETENRALGGGGGAGRIRINTRDGSAELEGTLSPSRASACVTLGTLGE